MTVFRKKDKQPWNLLTEITNVFIWCKPLQRAQLLTADGQPRVVLGLLGAATVATVVADAVSAATVAVETVAADAGAETVAITISK